MMQPPSTISRQPPHPDDLITANEVCKLLKISRRTFYRLRAQGRIPMPVIKTSRTSLRWRRGDILSAMDPCPSPHTIAGRIAITSTHARAAAMQARAAAIHADAAAASLRKLAAELANTAAIAEAPPPLSSLPSLPSLPSLSTEAH